RATACRRRRMISSSPSRPTSPGISAGRSDMRARLTLTLALLLAPMATRADDPVIEVDCLCVEDTQGWLRGRSDATTEEAGPGPLTSGESFMVLRAATDQCARFPSGCGDERFTPVTGERRARLDGAEYL